MAQLSLAPDAIPHAWARYFAAVNALAARRRGPLAGRLEVARRFLDAHLDHPLTLDEIARQAHVEVPLPSGLPGRLPRHPVRLPWPPPARPGPHLLTP